MKKLITIITLILFCSSAAFADSDKALYQTKVPVSSQSVEERNTAVQQAFQQVLIRVSGNSQILNNPKIKIPSSDVNALVQEFGYSKSAVAANGSGFEMMVQFDPEGINQLLQKADVAIWGAERPMLLVWAEWEVPNQPAEIIDSGSSNHIQTFLKNAAVQRGLPIIFPMMDIDDLNQVSVNDIATMAVPVLQNAAKRYNSNGLLILRAFQLVNASHVEARLVLGNDQWNWTLLNPSLDENLKALVTNVSDVLAQRYSTVVTPNVQAQATIKVVGINRHGDLAQVINYLKRLTPVADVDPTEVTGAEVVLSLSLRGSQNSLIQAISAENKLISEPGTDTDKKLIYRWNP